MFKEMSKYYIFMLTLSNRYAIIIKTKIVYENIKKIREENKL